MNVVSGEELAFAVKRHGFGTMNYVVFGIGLLLTASGSLSIYSGYDIIQVERGWTEVIAGTTAVSGGIITISLAMILSRLQVLCDLYKASIRSLDHDHFGSKPTAEPPLTASPLAARPEIAAPEPEAAILPEAPVFPRPQNAPKAKTNFFSSRGSKPIKPPVAQPSEISNDEPEPAILTGDVESEAQAPLLEFTEKPTPEPQTAPLSTVSLPPAAAALQLTSPPSPSGLSLDEMWKRVSEEMDKPIFPHRAKTSVPEENEASIAAPKTEGVQRAEALTEEPAPRSGASAHIPIVEHEAPDHDDFGRVQVSPAWPEPLAMPNSNIPELGSSKIILETSGLSDSSVNVIDSKNLERDMQTSSRSLHELDCTEKPAPTFSHPATDHDPAAAAALALDGRFNEDNPSANRFEAAWPRADQDHSKRETIEKPMLDPLPPLVPEPAVIGRYEAEGTAYLMFSDGSIEAQSAAGIFRFASMADLKAFIENKQAAESDA